MHAHDDDQLPWQDFTRWCLGTAAGLLTACWLFVALVDPHDHLAVGVPAERVPINPNQRFSYPAIARSPRFDSAVIGTSTVRMLNPRRLDRVLGARFANLAMNSATAHEQSRVLELFLRHHPRPAYLLVGIDAPWCAFADRYERYTFREFPEWLYDLDPWNDYLHLLSGQSLEQAARQVQHWLGAREPRYGRDGYRNFLPPDEEYDLARARVLIYGAGGVRERQRPATPVAVPEAERAAWRMPALDLLERALARVPRETHVALLFVPYHVFHQAVPDTLDAARWDECRRRIAALAAARPGTRALDFMIPSPITREDHHYWDPLHFDAATAARIEQSVARALADANYRDATFRWLHGP
jgi:hypothetical protein